MLLGFLPAIGPTDVRVLLTTAVFLIWPAWRICSKAGLPGPLGLLGVGPVLNLALLSVLAFAEQSALRGGDRRL